MSNSADSGSEGVRLPDSSRNDFRIESPAGHYLVERGVAPPGFQILRLAPLSLERKVKIQVERDYLIRRDPAFEGEVSIRC